MRNPSLPPPIGTPINKSHPLAQGLIGSWLLNEGGGKKAYDSTGVEIIPGVVTATGAYTQFTRGQSFKGDGGGNDSIDLGKQPKMDLATSPMTVSVWFYLTTAGATYSYMYSDLDTLGLNSQASVYYRNDQTVGFYWFNAGSFVLPKTTTTVVAGKWYHAVGVRSGVTGSWTAKIFLNGRLEASASTAVNPCAQATAGNIKIGTHGSYVSTGLAMHGYLQNVQVWNRALSETEVADLYKNPYAIFIKKRFAESFIGQAVEVLYKGSFFPFFK